MSHRPTSRLPKEPRGQILVIFALALVAITAMVGLVLDGGSAFAQRRAEQNAADLAALAAANDLIVNQGNANWQATALEITRANGFENGVNGVTVAVSCKNCPGQALETAYNGVQVTVDVVGPHRNAFAGIVGMPTWDVGVTATSLTGWIDTGIGPGPFIVSIDEFDGNTGESKNCWDKDHECTLKHPVDDAPPQAGEFTWTDFSYDKKCEDTGNVDDQDLQAYLGNRAVFSLTLDGDCYIAQHNNGVMNNIVRDLQGMAPMSFPVPVVNKDGIFRGWASFRMTSATANGRGGDIKGYFETNKQSSSLDVRSPGFGTATFGGSYRLKLIN
jgi:Flp pilus assembly protein TadG